MRTRVFIDGQWLHRVSGNLGFDTDFKRVRALYLPTASDTFAIEYFTIEAVRSDGESGMRKLLDWLELNGYRVNSLKVELSERDSIRENRSELMVWMALKIASAANHGTERIVIWSADRAMARAVQAAQAAGAEVLVVADLANCSTILRRAADTFVDLTTLRADIEQPIKIPA